MAKEKLAGKDLLEKTGYSWGGVHDIYHNTDQGYDLLMAADEAYRQDSDYVAALEKELERAKSSLSLKVNVLMYSYDVFKEQGRTECGKMTYTKGDEVVVVARTEDGIQYSSYVRCDIKPLSSEA